MTNASSQSPYELVTFASLTPSYCLSFLWEVMKDPLSAPLDSCLQAPVTCTSWFWEAPSTNYRLILGTEIAADSFVSA